MKGVSILPSVQEQSKSVQKLKQMIVPLLTQLLNSKESESKAGALNITGAICGIGIDLGVQDLRGIGHSAFKMKDFISQFRSDFNPTNPIQRLFLGGGRLLSMSLWQRIFQLSDQDWDQTIRDASAVLIQLCAPRQQVYQFITLQQEKFDTRLSQVIQSFQQQRNTLADAEPSLPVFEEESKSQQSDNESSSNTSGSEVDSQMDARYFYIE